MAVIRTEQNAFVYAYDPMPQDRWVKTLIGNRCLIVQHISQYQQAVAWAVSMAHQMGQQLHIVPFDVNDLVHLNQQRMERGLPLLTPEAQHRLRQDVVTTCLEAIHNCDDLSVRVDAYEVLQTIRMVQ